MPVYEYECQWCGTRFDLLRRMSEADDPAKCPKCAVSEVRRCVAGGHFALKGGGWYKDGYQK
jgi:putative FmdB family regulatory protein